MTLADYPSHTQALYHLDKRIDGGIEECDRVLNGVKVKLAPSEPPLRWLQCATALTRAYAYYCRHNGNWMGTMRCMSTQLPPNVERAFKHVLMANADDLPATARHRRVLIQVRNLLHTIGDFSRLM